MLGKRTLDILISELNVNNALISFYSVYRLQSNTEYNVISDLETILKVLTTSSNVIGVLIGLSRLPVSVFINLPYGMKFHCIYDRSWHNIYSSLIKYLENIILKSVKIHSKLHIRWFFFKMLTNLFFF